MYFLAGNGCLAGSETGARHPARRGLRVLLSSRGGGGGGLVVWFILRSNESRTTRESVWRVGWMSVGPSEGDPFCSRCAARSRPAGALGVDPWAIHGLGEGLDSLPEQRGARQAMPVMLGSGSLYGSVGHQNQVYSLKFQEGWWPHRAASDTDTEPRFGPANQRA